MEISEIKNIRKKLSLTQSELARLSGVSQSLIAKIEAGTLDPTYSNAKKIFAALDSIGKKNEMKAGDIMETKIVYASPKDTLKDVVAKMKKYEISQLPVVEDHNVVGLVSESTILDAIMNSRKGSVTELMEQSPPTVPKNASVALISELLRHYPIVVVGEKGRIAGIIAKSDLLRKVYSKS